MQSLLKAVNNRGGLIMLGGALLASAAFYSAATDDTSSDALLKSALIGTGVAAIGSVSSIRRRRDDKGDVYSASPVELVRDAVILPVVLAGGAYIFLSMNGNIEDMASPTQASSNLEAGESLADPQPTAP